MISQRLFAGIVFPGVLLFAVASTSKAADPNATTGDGYRGKALFGQNCALCHSDGTDAANPGQAKQGPSLIGVVGRKAGTGANFNYTQALTDSGMTWDAATLDRFLTNPAGAVPGTTMPIPTPDAKNRADIIAYLATLKFPDKAAPAPASVPSAPTGVANPDGDWQNAAPGKAHRIDLAKLPPPFSTRSAGNGPRTVRPIPAGAFPAAPKGFVVKLFASGLSNPRVLRIAPNGDIFLAETGAKRIRVFRAADGADTPTENQIFAEGLDRPFGIAFYPPGKDPQWIYIANNNSIVRLPYHNGDLESKSAPEVIVPSLTESHGGHSSRDIAFSLDGKRLFISVGSGSNVADGMSKKTPDEIHQWEAQHGFGASWDGETNRADILVCDPEGKNLHTYATGIRNGVGIAVDPENGTLWTSTNERDGLGDDLVPDYITSVKAGGYYGWPWYYMGNHEDPRKKGERPDLAGKAILPDVPVQAHSASLEMTFYPASEKGAAAFPAEYQGDIFAAFHGSWNRNTRTGYEVVRVHREHGVPTGGYEDFLTGFVVDNQSVWGRPVGVAVAHDGALLVSEDGNGTVWRIAPAGH